MARGKKGGEKDGREKEMERERREREKGKRERRKEKGKRRKVKEKKSEREEIVCYLHHKQAQKLPRSSHKIGYIDTRVKDTYKCEEKQ